MLLVQQRTTNSLQIVITFTLKEFPLVYFDNLKIIFVKYLHEIAIITQQIYFISNSHVWYCL